MWEFEHRAIMDGRLTEYILRSLKAQTILLGASRTQMLRDRQIYVSKTALEGCPQRAQGGGAPQPADSLCANLMMD